MQIQEIQCRFHGDQDWMFVKQLDYNGTGMPEVGYKVINGKMRGKPDLIDGPRGQ